MSAAAAVKQAGPSGSASKDKKPKRTRKRMRNKKRTAEVEDSSSSSSSDDGSSDDDDEEQKPKAAPVAKAESSSKKSKADSDSDSDSDSSSDEEDKDEDGQADGKRKRKRKRTQKKKTTQEGAESVATVPSTASASKVLVSAPKPMTLSPDEVGPDPNTDLRLSDQAKQAIQYAQIYIKDKPQWKFNKARQNWLLRNALSVPPSDYDATLARKQASSSSAAEGAAEDADEAEEGENFVPDDLVPVVTAYLTSVMGGARQRLIESLKEAINAPVVAVPQPQPPVEDDAAKATNTNEQDNGGAAEGAATKSVSFGNLALESEQKEEAAEAAGLPAGTDPHAVELRRQRATRMLEHMGEV